MRRHFVNYSKETSLTSHPQLVSLYGGKHRKLTKSYSLGQVLNRFLELVMSLQPPFLPSYTFNSAAFGSSLLRHFFHACWSKGVTNLYIPPGTIQGGVLYQNEEDIENVYVKVMMSVDRQTFFSAEWHKKFHLLFFTLYYSHLFS